MGMHKVRITTELEELLESEDFRQLMEECVEEGLGVEETEETES